MGKTVTLLDKDYIITAVYKDFGDGLIKHNDMIMSMSARGEKYPSLPFHEMLSGMVTMVKFKDRTDPVEAERKVKEHTVKHYQDYGDRYIDETVSAQGAEWSEHYRENFISTFKNRLADEHQTPACSDAPIGIARKQRTVCNSIEAFGCFFDNGCNVVAQDNEVHKVNDQLTENNGELVPRYQCTTNVAWSNFGNVHRTDG